MNNGQIADIFEEVADLLDLTADNAFRIRAYRNAARTIRSYPNPLTSLIKQGKKVSTLPALVDSLS